MTKTRVLCILLGVPLLGLTPLSHFLVHYYAGLTSLTSPYGSDTFLKDTAIILFFPWMVAALCTALAGVRWRFCHLIFFAALMLQYFLIFKIVPAGYASEMMGVAHTIRSEYSIAQIRICAEQLCQKLHDGTLKLTADETGKIGSIYANGVIVDDTELPAVLRGRFTRVLIWHVPDGYGTQVRFALNGGTEIICGQSEVGNLDQEVGPLDEYPLAEGIYAYRFHHRF